MGRPIRPPKFTTKRFATFNRHNFRSRNCTRAPKMYGKLFPTSDSCPTICQLFLFVFAKSSVPEIAMQLEKIFGHYKFGNHIQHWSRSWPKTAYTEWFFNSLQALMTFRCWSAVKQPLTPTGLIREAENQMPPNKKPEHFKISKTKKTKKSERRNTVIRPPMLQHRRPVPIVPSVCRQPRSVLWSNGAR